MPRTGFLFQTSDSDNCYAQMCPKDAYVPKLSDKEIALKRAEALLIVS